MCVWGGGGVSVLPGINSCQEETGHSLRLILTRWWNPWSGQLCGALDTIDADQPPASSAGQ